MPLIITSNTTKKSIVVNENIAKNRKCCPVSYLIFVNFGTPSLEKSTPTPVVAVVTNISYVQAGLHKLWYVLIS